MSTPSSASVNEVYWASIISCLPHVYLINVCVYVFIMQLGNRIKMQQGIIYLYVYAAHVVVLRFEVIFYEYNSLMCLLLYLMMQCLNLLCNIIAPFLISILISVHKTDGVVQMYHDSPFKQKEF